MKNLLLFLSVIFTALFASAQTPTDLFFSEYVEGSGNNKGVEIYNPTNQPIDLSKYYVVRFSNGSSVFTEGGVTKLIGTLQPYTTHVLINGQTTSTSSSPACSPELQAMADQLDGAYPAPTYMNGNDAIALIKTPNGEAPNTNLSNVTSVDLIGQIGLGNLISGETGWSYVKDTTVNYTANELPVSGKVINYIVQSKATNGTSFGPFWMSWTSDHTLIRKPHIVKGVVTNPIPFNVSMEWDTVPAKIDTAGHFVYKDIWDKLGSHACIADPAYPSAIKETSFTGTITIYPNPVVADRFSISASLPFKSVQIFDVIGKEVYSLTLSSASKQTEVLTAGLDNGMYLVKIVFSDKSTSVQKILVK
jgi:hypothetical protein